MQAQAPSAPTNPLKEHKVPKNLPERVSPIELDRFQLVTSVNPRPSSSTGFTIEGYSRCPMKVGLFEEQRAAGSGSVRATACVASLLGSRLVKETRRSSVCSGDHVCGIPQLDSGPSMLVRQVSERQLFVRHQKVQCEALPECPSTPGISPRSPNIGALVVWFRNDEPAPLTDGSVQLGWVATHADPNGAFGVIQGQCVKHPQTRDTRPS